MPHEYDILIIGAGPAGLMAAITAAETAPKARIAILEKNASAGKKLLISGSGRCNVTHAGSMADFLTCYGDHAQFIKPALLEFTNLDMLRFLASHHLNCVELDGGKIFPKSQKSGDVLRVLLSAIEAAGVPVQYQQPVAAIRCEEPLPSQSVETTPAFEVRTPSDVFRARCVILSTGGKTFPATGSNGDGFTLAKQLGHSIVAARPALAPVYVRDFTLVDCAGISVPNAVFQQWRDGRKLRTLRGDVLLTHFGLSGPGILNGSRWFQSGDELRLVLGDPDAILEQFPQNAKKELKNQLSDSLGLAVRFVELLLEQAGIAPQKRVCDVTRAERLLLRNRVLQPAFTIARLGGDSEAKATAGGVSLDEVNRKSMQSRLVPGLFFCGEVLDIDGDTGGYNLQFAWSSGHMAGKNSAKMLEQTDSL